MGGIDKNGNTCRWNGLTFTKIKLETKKKLKCITVGDSCVYGLTETGKVMKWNNENSEWNRAIKGKISDIDVGNDGSLWCITTHGFIGRVLCDELVNVESMENEDLPSIQRVAGNYKCLTATNSDDLWAVDEETKIIDESAASAAIAELALLKEQMNLLKNQFEETKQSNTSEIDLLNQKVLDLESSNQQLVNELNSKNE